MKESLVLAVTLLCLAGCEDIQFGQSEIPNDRLYDNSLLVGDASVDSTFRPAPPSTNIQIPAEPPQSVRQPPAPGALESPRRDE